MGTLEEYLRLREAQKSLNRKLINRLQSEPRAREFITRAAKALGYRVENREIIFDSEASVDRLYDYLIHEVEPNRKSVARRFLESKPVLPPEEMQVLQAAVLATTSLYEVGDIERANIRFRVSDLLRERPDFWVTDVGFSSTLTGRIILFARVFEVGEVAFVSGAAIAFGPSYRTFLVELARSLDRIKNDALRACKRYALFVRLEPTSSIKTIYR
jgi:hypothetical protein